MVKGYTRGVLLLALLITSVSLTTQACVHTPPNLSAPGKAAYTADQVVIRVNELQNTAIAAEAVHQLSTDLTRKIVTFCVAADKTLAATPAGWATTLSTAWLETKRSLGPVTNPSIAASMAAVDVVLAVQGGQ